MNGLFAKVTPKTMHEYSRRLWEDKFKVKYPYHATSSTNIDPSTLPEIPYGKFASVVMETGIRTWGFANKNSRDIFVKRHSARELTR